MEVVSIRNYSGRNIYSHKPVIKMTVDLGEFTEILTKDITGFNFRLLSCFPGLKTHCCSPGYEGGFVYRLTEGTLVSHVIEHLALELQCLMGYEVSFGKTRVIKEPSMYLIIYEYINQHCAPEFGYSAVEIVSAIVRNDIGIIDEVLERLNTLTLEKDLGPSTKAILAEAKKRHIPYRQLGEQSLFQLGYGSYMQFIEASLPGTTSSINVDLAKNKQLAKELLREHLIPVPEGGIVGSEYAAVNMAEKIGYPLVVKPLDGNHGRGVTINIYNVDTLRTAYRIASSYSKQVIVEKYIKGKDYRILVVGHQVAAVAERKPPFVLGDGIHSILELIRKENENKNRGVGHEKSLTKIYVDKVTEDFLSRSGFSIYDIPEAGQVIFLRENGNLSTGGSARDCTMEIHSYNKELAVKAATVIGLDVAGIDVIAADISQPMTAKNAAVIEVNAAPGLRMHLSPTEGQGRNVAADILDFMYPEGTPASIPVVSVTGTNGKTTVTRLLQHVLALSGKKTGMTCSSGTYIGKECIARGDNTGPLSAKSILYNREVEAAVLETARGGIISRGLGYDLADVGIIVNISEDHLGLDGVNTLQDLAFVKSLVIEAVKPEGYAVLNADDSMTEQIAAKVECNLILFSQNRNNNTVKSHIDQGGTAVVTEKGALCLYQDNKRKTLIKVSEIPITFAGKASCNIENSLAAAAGLIALGVPHHIIKSGLMSFMPDSVANAGRLNLFDMGNFQVLLDYGHNLSGYRSVLQFASQLDAERLVGVIGIPGDRIDKSIYEVGQISGQAFSKLYIKEDQDLRGRASGVVASILYHGAINGGARKENIEIILSEADAMEAAIKNAAAGDLIIMFYESFDAVFELLQDYMNQQVQPISMFPAINTDIPVSPHLPVEYIQ